MHYSLHRRAATFKRCCSRISWHAWHSVQVCALSHKASASTPASHHRTIEEHLNQISASQAGASSRLPRFYTAQPLNSLHSASVTLTGEEARHAYVLRLQPGELLELADGAGFTQTCRVSASDKTLTLVDTLDPAPIHHPWSGPEWVVAVGCMTLKGGRADWLVEKCVELGARAVIPLITDRSQAQGKSKFKVKGAGSDGSDDFQPGRLERVAISATKQSLRTHGLTMHPPTNVATVAQLVADQSCLTLVAVAGAPALRLVLEAWQQEQGQEFQEQYGSQERPGLSAAARPLHMLLVGPEGDFTPSELQLLLKAGARPVGLGPHRLRTETAAVALLAAASFWQQT